MTIKELVKKGLLKEVDVQKPPDDVIDAGNERFVAELNIPESGGGPRRMRVGVCQSNSICIVEEMRARGEDDWYIVPGFAFNPEKQDPIIHVWVRKGLLHYDPTWSLDLCNYNLEDCRYFQLVQPLETSQKKPETATQSIRTAGKAILKEVEDFASKWGLKVATRD
jgi:hypothetical protein